MSAKPISRQQVKDFAPSMAKGRSHQFTRVSADFYLKVEGQVKEFIRQYVRSLPSKGKTIT